MQKQIKRKKGQATAQPGTTFDKKQAAFLKALVECDFNVSRAAAKTGVGRRTVYHWREENQVFREKWDDLAETKLDHLEEALYQRATEGASDTCLIFSLKTLGKARGYMERENVNAKAMQLLEDILTEKITIREAAYKISGMGLPLPEILKIELSKMEPEPPDNGEGITAEELDRKFHEAIALADKQRDDFLPQRRKEVATMKKEMVDTCSFDNEKQK